MIKIYKSLFIVMFSIFLFSGCGSSNSQNLSPLQLEQLQTKYYNAKYNDVFRAIINTLQSEGLMINSMNEDLGVLTAKGISKFEGIDMFTFSGGIKSSIIKMMVTVKNVNEEKTKVRISINKEITGKTAFGGGSSSEFIVEDSKVYNSIFSKIQKSLFIETSID